MGQTLPRLRSSAEADSAVLTPNDAPIFFLPAVSVQQVMHFLPAADIIKLARCSKRLYRDGGEPFAWKVATITLNIDHKEPPPTLLQTMFSSSKQLLRKSTALLPSPWVAKPAVVPPRPLFLAHARITLNWPIRGFHIPPYHLNLAVLALLDRIPAVHSFTTTVVSVPPMKSRSVNLPVTTALCTILGHPKMRALSSLKLYDAARPGYATLEMMRAIAALPALTHLDITVSAGIDHSVWERLTACPSLTSLHLHDNQTSQAPNRLTHVAQCPHLTALSISMPSLHGSQFRSFFLSEHMRRLVKLKLDWLHCNGRVSILCEGIPQADFAEVFGALTLLEEIHLSRVHDIDAMLPHLALAPALRRCVIQPECEPSGRLRQLNSAMPSEAVLHSLMDGAPRLQLLLFLQSSAATPRPVEHVPPIPPLHMLHLLRPLITAMKQAYPQRFEVEPNV